MHKVKYLFFAYLLLVLLIIVGIGASFALSPPRDPNTNYTSLVSNIKTLDPAEVNDLESDRIAGCIFECLYNYEYGKVPYTLIPELAEGQPQTSEDRKSLTIHLKTGIHFYDPTKQVWPDGFGPEIKAADLIYSWKRVCNFHLGLTAQYATIFQGRVAGIDDWYNYTQSCATPDAIDWSRPVDGLIALDDHTLKVVLIDPYPQFRYNLAHLSTAAVSRDAVAFFKDKFNRHPVGSGPYMLTDYLPEQRMVLEANPIYRGGPNVESGAQLSADERLPHIHRVEFGTYEENLPRWYLFREGLLDANDIPKETFNQAISTGTADLSPEMKNEGIHLIKASMPDVYFVGFNMLDPVVGKNKPLRQAMSMAFDRKQFIDVFLNGRAELPIGPIPPGFPTFDPNEVNPYTQFNLAAARQKMKDAEAVNGGPIPTLKILIGDTTTSARQEAEFFVSQMAQIGVNVDAEYTTWARFQERVDNKQAQIFFLGWDADYPDEQTFWQLLYSKNAGVGGVNSANYANPAFDALYEQSSVMEPGPQRDELYRKMQVIMIEDCPWILQFYPAGYLLYHDWLSNVQVSDYPHGARAYIRLDSDKRRDWLKQH